MSCQNIVFWNVNRVNDAKQGEIDLQVSSVASNVLFLGLCETKEPPLNDPAASPFNYCRDLPNFQTYRKPFSANSAGLLAFVHNSVAVRPRPELEASPHVLSLECRFPAAPSPCLVIVCYRSAAEGKAGWEAVRNSLSSAISTKLPLIIVGDFNARSQFFGDPKNDYFGGLLSDFCDDNALFVLNPMLCPDRPTRKCSVLDLAIVTDVALVSRMSVAGKHGFRSDHRSIELDLAFTKISHEPPKAARTRWDFDKADWSLFRETLMQKSAAVLSACEDDAATATTAQIAVDSMIERLSKMYDCAAELAVGRVAVKASQTPWWKSHPDLHPLLAAYRRAKKRYDRKGNAERKQELDSSWKAWRDGLARARNQRWARECQNISAGGQVNWRAFKYVHKPATFPINCIRDSGGNLPTSTQEALNSLAKHFADVCTLPELKNPSEEQKRCRQEVAETISVAEKSQCSEMDKQFELQEIVDAIKLFKNPKSAAGPDQIPTMFLKRSPESVLRVLQFIFNYSWKHGVCPKKWRQANVCAILKPGSADRSSAPNYRPISLTSVICKLLERVILRRLWDTVGHRINARQFGFCSGKSTVDALLRLQHKVFDALKKRHHLSVAFLDISKAFDRTWHDGLLHKLSRIGVAGNAWRWCRAFLSERQLRTVHDAQCSDWFNINAGVPQGSVLSPFLFLVYINDVFEVCGDRAELSLFADDIDVVPNVTGAEGDGKLFKALTMLDSWSKLWRLDFNAKKSKVLKFSVNSKKKVQRNGLVSEFFLGSEIIERVTYFDYLGLRWQQNGQWHQHLQKVCISAKRVSNLICSIVSRDAPSLPIIRFLVHALVRSKFCYGVPVWKASGEAGWKKLDSIVADPMRRRLGLPKSAFILSILAETNTLPMKLQHEMALVMQSVRANHLPAGHVTRAVREEQEAQLAPIKKRTPVFVAALQVISKRGIDVKKLDSKSALVKFTCFQRLEWRQSGKGKFLRMLTSGGYHPGRRKFCLPEYLHVDKQSVATIRAKLRFDRSNLKDTLRRQRIIKTDEEALCDRCKPAPVKWNLLFLRPEKRRYIEQHPTLGWSWPSRFRETLSHVLFVCSSLGRKRDALKAKAAALGLSTKRSDMLHWLLGNLEDIDTSLHRKALKLGASFLSLVNSVRPL